MIFEQIATGGRQSNLSGCEATLAAATLRELGFGRAVALDGGTKAWREAEFPLES